MAAPVPVPAQHGSRWEPLRKHLEGGPINVREFGARGDGVTDDTAAIQAAIDAAWSLGRAAVVPPGIHRVSGLKLKTGARLLGSGYIGNQIGWYLSNPSAASTLKATANTVNVIEVDGDADGYSISTEIAYLGILGSNGSAGVPTSVSVSYAAWAGSTAYVACARCSTARGDVYECIADGTSDATPGATGPKGYGSDITDGSAHWAYVGLGHGIYIHGSAMTLGNSGLDIHHVTVGGMAGKGIFAPWQWFTRIGPFVHVDACAEHLIDISGGVTTRISDSYLHRVAANKAGIRVHYQGVMIDNVDGIDLSGAGASWGVFGDTAAEDGQDRSLPVTILGCNVEAFKEKGIHLKYGSTAFIRGTSFIGTEPNAVALQLDYPGEGMTLDESNRFSTSGSWLNGYAIHVVNSYPICFGHIVGVWQNASVGNQGWNDTYGRAVVLPGIDQSSEYLRLTALNVLNGGYLNSFNTGTSAIIARGTREFTGITWSASPVADGGVSTATLAYAGFAQGMLLRAFYRDQYVPAGLLVQAVVSSAGNAAVTIYNRSGGDYTPPTGTLYVELIAHN